MNRPAETIPAGSGAEGIETPFGRFVADFRESRLAMVGLAVLLGIVAMAVLAPWISPQNPYDLRQLSILDGKQPPGSQGMAGFRFWLGSDDQGRDILSGIFFGLRISLGVGILSALIAMTIGLAAGLAAAYHGGTVDSIIMRLVDMQLSFPAILIALILLALLGQGVDKIVVALVTVQWAYYARTVRAAALAERHREYIEAAHCLALRPWRIVLRHLLPNSLPPVIVVVTVQVAHAISLEATLSFLGIGLPITEPSLGLLIANGFQYLLSGTYWISFFPGLALLVTIVAINLVGDQLRDILNPRLQK